VGGSEGSALNRSSRILGIDPGSRITGYGVVERQGGVISFIACGVIKSTPSFSFPDRLKEIHDGVLDVIDCHRPEQAAVEDIFFAKNASSALKLGQARGAILIALLNRHLMVREFTAKQVKQAVAGYGQASKAQVQHMVRLLLNLSASPSEDAADGLAIALCLTNHLRDEFL
jgi:crossover junction endodeoxyribonuclease RuvC